MSPRALTALTFLNLALLAVLLAQQLAPALAQGEAPILRGRGLEIVDAQGRVRASFAGPTGTKEAWLILQTSGNESSLRLRNEDGREQVLRP